MNFNSIDKKSKIGTDINLARPSILFSQISGSSYTEHYVSSYDVCRIDSISLKYYGVGDLADLILKFNNISNPFAINEGDIIKIPDMQIPLKPWADIIDFSYVETNDVKAQFMDTKRLTKKDKARIEYLKAAASKKANGVKTPLPPNILQNGDENVSVTGEGISLNPTSCDIIKNKNSSSKNIFGTNTQHISK